MGWCQERQQFAKECLRPERLDLIPIRRPRSGRYSFLLLGRVGTSRECPVDSGWLHRAPLAGSGPFRAGSLIEQTASNQELDTEFSVIYSFQDQIVDTQDHLSEKGTQVTDQVGTPPVLPSRVGQVWFETPNCETTKSMAIASVNSEQTR